VGVDFQGRRYAAEASRMVLDLARRRGIGMMFTSAYDDNARSKRALERLGFVPMPLRALPPEADRQFFYLRLDPCACKGINDPDSALVDYYRREKLAISFVGYPPFVPEPVAGQLPPDQAAPSEPAQAPSLAH
jgi:hypothetical protein